jgi:hypothetical protein
MHVSYRNRHMIRLNQDKINEIQINDNHEIYSSFLNKMKIKDGVCQWNFMYDEVIKMVPRNLTIQ